LIHATAIIDPSAHIATGVSIGPYSVIGADVEIGENTWIGPHVVINGPTKIGCDNRIHQFASIGEAPQDLKFQGEKTWLIIGDRNTIREFCTMNRGTVQDNSQTIIGNDNLFMAYVHIAHDCIVGNQTVFANNASLSGHVVIEDYVVLGGFAGVLQTCRVGAYGFVSMGVHLDKDVPPFVKVADTPPKPYGLNSVGLTRRGFDTATLKALRQAYRIIYRKGLLLKDALVELEALATDAPAVRRMIEFIQASKRGIVR
jgi:UDP-N-acetylglucosamine acyltransferase